jgi:hypothetical protein
MLAVSFSGRTAYENGLPAMSTMTTKRIAESTRASVMTPLICSTAAGESGPCGEDEEREHDAAPDPDDCRDDVEQLEDRAPARVRCKDHADDAECCDCGRGGEGEPAAVGRRLGGGDARFHWASLGR